MGILWAHSGTIGCIVLMKQNHLGQYRYPLGSYGHYIGCIGLNQEHMSALLSVLLTMVPV